MNGVQLYTIVHFGGDIVRPKIRSIVNYVEGSTKLTLLREHSSYKDFVILLKETSEICREDSKMYNFVHGCACAISSVQNFTAMINMHKTNPDTPFHIWIVNDLRIPSQNSQNFISNLCSSGKGLPTTKDTGSGRGLSTTKAGGPLRHNSFPDPEPEYRGYPKINCRGLDPRRFGPFVDDKNDSFKTNVPPSNEPSIPQSNVHLLNEPVLTNVPQSNEPFQTIPTNVPLSNEPYILQSSIYLSNEPVLTNVPPSNEPMLTNIPLSIEPEPIIGQTETLAEFRFEPQSEQEKDLQDFWFKSVAYTEDPYNLSKEFNIGDLYRDRIELKNHIRAYAVVNKFNLEHVLSNEYKIVMTSYGRTDYVNIEDGIFSCRWWQAMGIPCEHGVRALDFANVDPTTCVSEYYTNNTYKAVYEPIWIPIRGIEQWKILKTDLHVRAPIPTVRAGRPRAQRKRSEKNASSCYQAKILQQVLKKWTQSSFL
ncbi:hypothetical protein GIB67_016658 [Kingdonia uniflora]|uniref:SWIM-type domain-containing protein n=1 Tax=Kingdonia uniflora TaxID=39325 RepID=A0A7J7MZP8_9MAGN|nr:hypothetical protein GIB67_016658 [Kingdonia uniflora]